jgi:hypothetical protein
MCIGHGSLWLCINRCYVKVRITMYLGYVYIQHTHQSAEYRHICVCVHVSKRKYVCVHEYIQNKAQYVRHKCICESLYTFTYATHLTICWMCVCGHACKCTYAYMYMYMCVCVCARARAVCVHVHVCVYIHTCTYVRVYTYVFMFIWVCDSMCVRWSNNNNHYMTTYVSIYVITSKNNEHKCVYVNVYTYACVYIYVYICINVICICICVCICIYNIHVHMRVCVHAQIQYTLYM